MAYCYSHIFGIAATGLRFFTVYGPWGRPDMAPFRFARAIDRGEPMDIYNYGRMLRDFTYVGDIVEGLARIIECQPPGCRLYNIGNSVAGASDGLCARASKKLSGAEPSGATCLCSRATS